jgi:hypothetical protein
MYREANAARHALESMVGAQWARLESERVHGAAIEGALQAQLALHGDAVEEMARLAESQEENTRLQQEANAVSAALLQQIARELLDIEHSMERGFDAVVRAQEATSFLLKQGFHDVRLGLDQLDEKLGEISDILRTPRRTEVDELCADAVRALAVGRLLEARSSLDEALRLKPVHFLASYLNGQLAIEEADHSKAVGAFGRAVDFADTQGDAVVNRNGIELFGHTAGCFNLPRH